MRHRWTGVGRRAAAAWVLAAAVVSACAGERVVGPPSPPAALAPPVRRDVALALESVVLTINGVEHTAAAALGQRLAGRFRDARLFTTVYAPANAELAPHGSARGRCRLDERYDEHTGANVSKLVLISLTLLALMPVLPFEYDAGSTLECTVTLPEGPAMAQRATTAITVSEYSGRSDQAISDALARALSLNIDAVIAGFTTDPVFAPAPAER